MMQSRTGQTQIVIKYCRERSSRRKGKQSLYSYKQESVMRESGVVGPQAARSTNNNRYEKRGKRQGERSQRERY